MQNINKGSFQLIFMRKEVVLGIATLMGTIIGAGILSLPYLVAKVGLIVGLTNILFVGLLTLMLHLFVGEIALRTKEKHQLTGYAGIYLGKIGKEIMTITMMFSLYGALTAYVIGEGDILHAIFKTLTPFHWSLIYFAIVSIIVYRGIKSTSKVELSIILLMIVAIITIAFLSHGKIDDRFVSYYDWSSFYIPYGAALFAMMGVFGVPELVEVMKNDKEKIKKAIFIGTIIPVIIYLVFVTVVVGIIGTNFLDFKPHQRIATVALGMFVQPEFALLANLFGVLAMTTSFLALGIALTEMYNYDYKIKRTTSWIAAMAIPLIVLLLGVREFIKVVSLTGAIADGILGTLIVIMFYRAKRRSQRTPEFKVNVPLFFGILMGIAFIAGIILSIF